MRGKTQNTPPSSDQAVDYSGRLYPTPDLTRLHAISPTSSSAAPRTIDLRLGLRLKFARGRTFGESFGPSTRIIFLLWAMPRSKPCVESRVSLAIGELPWDTDLFYSRRFTLPTFYARLNTSLRFELTLNDSVGWWLVKVLRLNPPE